MSKTIYFARPVWTNDTLKEIAIVEALEVAGYTVINPNAPEHAAGYLAAGMDCFTDLVKSADEPVYLGEDPDAWWSIFDCGNRVGAGVAKEILEHLVHGKRVSTLYFDERWKIRDQHEMPSVILTIEQTRAHRAEQMAKRAA